MAMSRERTRTTSGKFSREVELSHEEWTENVDVGGNLQPESRDRAGGISREQIKGMTRFRTPFTYFEAALACIYAHPNGNARHTGVKPYRLNLTLRHGGR